MKASVADIKKIQDLVTSLLAQMGASAKPRVFAVEEYVKIEIDGADSSLLIGYHGETLRSLKHILTAIVKKQISEDAVVLVDVSDYLARKEQRIKDLAQKAVEKAQKTKKPVELAPMNPFERRIVHSHASEQGLTSESTGEGFERRVIINP